MKIGALAMVVALGVAGCAQQRQIASPRVPTTQEIVDETPEAHDQRMAWWREAKFGMFIHFGLYSEAAGSWKGKPTSGAGEWIMHDMKIPPAEYEAELLPKFDPEKFDAKQWVRIAKNAGMKYIVITSKHHDGFSLYDSKVNPYNVMATPFKRDIMKELSEAAHAQGIEICWYHSIMDWHHPLEKADTFARYREEVLKPQLRELLTNYGRIGVLWFDGEWIKEWTEEQGKELYVYLRQIQPDLIINNRISKARAGMQGTNKYQGAGDYGTPEQQVPGKGPAGDWETCMTMNGTWGFKAQDQAWKDVPTLIHTLVDVASKGGNFLLNVGPTGEGLIPQASVDRLAAMGKWMDVNGESVYGTERSPFEKEFDWGKVTMKGTVLYAHVFKRLGDGKIVLPVENRVRRARMLGSTEKLSAKEMQEGVVLLLPAALPDGVDTVIKVELSGPIRIKAGK